MSIIINLNGSDGNAYVLLAMAKRLCGKLGMIDERESILKEMKASDYKHLVKTFEKHFGEFVTIEK